MTKDEQIKILTKKLEKMTNGNNELMRCFSKLHKDLKNMDVELNQILPKIDTLKKFLNALIDETYPLEKISLVLRTNKITLDEVRQALNFLDNPKIIIANEVL